MQKTAEIESQENQNKSGDRQPSHSNNGVLHFIPAAQTVPFPAPCNVVIDGKKNHGTRNPNAVTCPDCKQWIAQRTVQSTGGPEKRVEQAKVEQPEKQSEQPAQSNKEPNLLLVISQLEARRQHQAELENEFRANMLDKLADGLALKQQILDKLNTITNQLENIFTLGIPKAEPE